MKRLLYLMCCIIIAGAVLPNSVVNAAEKRIITRQEYEEEEEKALNYGIPERINREDYDSEEEYDEAFDRFLDACDEYDENSDKYQKKGCKLLYKKVMTYNGAYQENGAKIYTVTNAATKTFKKTGKYSIIVGGTTAKKDEGTVKFVAPKSGKYRISLDTRNTLVDLSGITIEPSSSGESYYNHRLLYRTDGVYTRNPNTSDILIGKEKGTHRYNSGGFLGYTSQGLYSEMQACVGWIRMKKGEYVKFRCRSSSADVDEEWAYSLAGFDLTITKE